MLKEQNEENERKLLFNLDIHKKGEMSALKWKYIFRDILLEMNVYKP